MQQLAVQLPRIRSQGTGFMTLGKNSWDSVMDRLVRLRMDNQAEVTIRVFYVESEGQEHFVRELAPGESTIMNTFNTHMFRSKELDGKTLSEKIVDVRDGPWQHVKVLPRTHSHSE